MAIARRAGAAYNGQRALEKGRGLHFLRTLSTRLGLVLAQYGPLGLVAINFLDSSFLAFPVINDLLLLHLSAQQPSKAWIFAFASTCGSVAGAQLMYEIPRRGLRFWHRRSRVEEREISSTQAWLARNDMLTVMVASLLPPPAPFKIVPLAAGALRVNAARFVTALFFGRALRFGAESWIGMRYGGQAEAFLRRNWGWASWSAAILILAVTLAYRWIQRGFSNNENR